MDNAFASVRDTDRRTIIASFVGSAITFYLWYKVISLCVIFLVGFYAPGFRVGRLGWFSLNNVSWQGRRVWVEGIGVADQGSAKKLEKQGRGERTRVKVGSVALRTTSWNDRRRKHWVALRISRVTIRVPKAHLEPNKREADASEDVGHDPPPSNDSTHPPAGKSGSAPLGPLRPVWWLFTNLYHGVSIGAQHTPLSAWWQSVKHFLRHMLLSFVGQVSRRSAWIVGLFAVELVDINLDVDKVCHIRCSVAAGVEVYRGKPARFCLWAAVRNFEIHKSDLAFARQSLAFAIPCVLDFSASAPFNSDLDLETMLEHGKRGVLCAPRSIDAAVLHYETALAKRRGPARPQAVLIYPPVLYEIAAAIPRHPKPQQSPRGSPKPDPPGPIKASKWTLLRRVDIRLPTIQSEWHHTALPSELARNPNAPASATVVGQIVGLFLDVDLSNETGGSGQEDRKHVEWHGKDADVVFRAAAGFKCVQAGMSVNGVPEDPLTDHSDPSSKLLHIGETSIVATSTWLPSKVAAKLGRRPPPTFLHDASSLLVFETDVGLVQGQLRVDDLLSVVALAVALRGSPIRQQEQPQTNPPRDGPKANAQVKEPPPFIGGITFAGVQMRLLGPELQGPLPLGSEEGDEQHPSRWKDPDALHVDLGRVGFNVRSVLSDVSLRRDDHQRRDARRLARRARIHVPESLRGIEISESHTKSIEGDRHLDDRASERTSSNAILAAYPLPGASGSKHRIRTIVDIFRSDGADFLYDVTAACTIAPLRIYLREGRYTQYGYMFGADHNLLNVGPISVLADALLPALSDCDERQAPVLDVARREGAVHVSINQINGDLSNLRVVSSLCHLIQAAALFKSRSAPKKPDRPPSGLSRTSSVPADISLRCAVSAMRMRLAGTDPHFEPFIARGISFEGEQILVESFRQSAARPGVYNFPDRQKLHLQEDIRVQTNAVQVERPNQDAALLKFTIHQIRVRPIAESSRRLEAMKSPNPTSAFEDAYFTTWELKNRSRLVGSHAKHAAQAKSPYRRAPELVDDVLYLPDFTIRVTLAGAREPEAHDDDRLIGAVAMSQPLFSHLEMRHIYSTMVALSTVRHVSAWAASHSSKKPDAKPPASHSRGMKTEAKVDLHAVHLHVVLSKLAPIFVELTRVDLRSYGGGNLSAQWDRLRIYSKSVTHLGKWDEIIGAKGCIFTAIHKENRGYAPIKFTLTGDTLRLRIPFKFILAEIIDSIGTFVKSNKQLAHQFLKGGHRSVIQPVAEEAKKVPEIALAFRIVVVQIEDDPFENRLNAIWRAGCVEINERGVRQEAFEQKVADLEAAKAAAEESASDSSSLSSDRSHKLHEGESDASSVSRSDTDSHRSDEQSEPVAIEEAFQRLEAYNATAWTKRIRNAVAEQARNEDAITRQLYGHVVTRHQDELPIETLPPLKLTPLARIVIFQAEIVVSRPSFGIEGTRDFLHEVGQGLPKDTEFTILIPLHLEWRMHGARIRLRDFPLFLLHIPQPAQDTAPPTWELKTDFVVAEELRGHEAIRLVPMEIIPKKYAEEGRPYSLSIPRTVSPVKTYALPEVRVKAPGPVRLGWGNSMSPALQDLMRAVDSITKPPADPSPRIGFWDKIRMILHWRVIIHFEGDSDVVFHMKGSRDPYQVLGAGAGYAKVWRGDVKFLIGHENKDHEVFQITSDDYILGVPNLAEYIDSAASGSAPTPGRPEDAQDDNGATSSFPGHINRSRTEFLKVLAKLTNGVRWGLGLKLERTCDPEHSDCKCSGSTFHRECRLWDFKPHYEVKLRGVEVVKEKDGHISDSYRGFRSDFIHFSLSITSPTSSTSDEAVETEIMGGGRANSIHFAPEHSTHFFLWWKTFDSALSLPVRQGKLFPQMQAPSKKFGKHIATMKYAFRIHPLFWCHTYRQDSSEDWIAGRSSIIGIKARTDRFHADLHQRATEISVRNEKLDEHKKVIRKVFYAAEIDCENVEFRAISAIFASSRKAAYASDVNLAGSLDQDEVHALPEIPRLSGRDRHWFDMDDLKDLLLELPDEEPAVQFFDTAACPRISYLRRPTPPPRDVERSDGSPEDPLDSSEKSKFGEEDSHSCLLGSSKDAMLIQLELLDERLEELESQHMHLRRKGVERDSKQCKEIRGRMEAVRKLRKRVGRHVDQYLRMREGKKGSLGSEASDLAPEDDDDDEAVHQLEHEEDMLGNTIRELYEQESNFINRLLVHSLTLLLSNSTRDILLKYHFSSRSRKGFMYHLSPQLLKFINELQEGTLRGDRHPHHRRKTRAPPAISHSHAGPDAEAIIDMLKHGGQSVKTVDLEHEWRPGGFGDTPENLAEKDLPEHFACQAAQLVLLMRLQIAFKSEVDDTSTVIITAFQAQLKSFNVLDVAVLDDPVNARVLRRSFASVRGVQAFYPTEGALSTRPYDPDTEGHKWHYAFVPVEVLVDLHLEPWGFDRLLPRSAASIRYDKFNQLRIRKQARSSFESASQDHLRSSTDWIKVDADALSVTADPQHFRAIYNVVTDLCLYTDPSQKERSAAIDTMLYTFGVENLGGIADEIISRQMTIRRDRRSLADLPMRINDIDDDDEAEDYTGREYRLWRHSDELGLLVQAIQRSSTAKTSIGQERGGAPTAQLDATANQISWFMNGKGSTPIAKLTVDQSHFEWQTFSDTSIRNHLAIGNMVAFNVSPNPHRTFDEIVSRYEDPHAAIRSDKAIFKAIWKTLPPVGGISIIDAFEMRIHPLRLQIDYEEGVQIFEYVFGATKAKPNDSSPSEQNGDSKHGHSKHRMISVGSRRRTGSILSEGSNGTHNSEDGRDDSSSVLSHSRSQESLVSSVRSLDRDREREQTSSHPHHALLRPGWRGRPDRSASTPVRKMSQHSIRSDQSIRSVSAAQSRAPSPTHRSGPDTPSQGGSGRTRTTQHQTVDSLLSLTKRENHNAEEMKRRAREYRTFLLINVEPTTLVLSYRGPKYVDVYGLVIGMPPLHYQSRTWSFQDFFDAVKSQITSSILKQTPHLISQFIATAHRNTAIPKKMGRKVVGGLGGLKLKVTKATAERMAKAPTSEAQARLLEESVGISTGGVTDGSSSGSSGSSGSGSGDSNGLGGKARNRKSSGASETSAIAATRKPTSPLRFVVQPPTMDEASEQAWKEKTDEEKEVEVEVKAGGPAPPPALASSVLGGKTMIVEEPSDMRLDDGDVGEPKEMKNGSKEGQSASSSQEQAHKEHHHHHHHHHAHAAEPNSASSSQNSATAFLHRHGILGSSSGSGSHSSGKKPGESSSLGRKTSREEAKAKARLLLGRSYDGNK